MMELLRQDEETPATYPAGPSGLSTEAQGLHPAMVWERLEGFTAHRWAERTVTWVVEGPGWFVLPLKPAIIDSSEVWNGSAWETTALIEAPIGYSLEASTYRVIATVGGGPIPEDVLEAYRRFAEYVVDTSDMGRVVTSSSEDVGGISLSVKRPVGWLAKAIHYSGAADLLRRYRSRY